MLFSDGERPTINGKGQRSVCVLSARRLFLKKVRCRCRTSIRSELEMASLMASGFSYVLNPGWRARALRPCSGLLMASGSSCVLNGALGVSVNPMVWTDPQCRLNQTPAPNPTKTGSGTSSMAKSAATRCCISSFRAMISAAVACPLRLTIARLCLVEMHAPPRQ